MVKAMPLGQDFPFLACRVLYGYLAYYPPFVSREGEADETSQAQMHAFLHDVLTRCYEQPSLMDAPQYPDACFESAGVLNREDPALAEAIQAVRKRLYTLLDMLWKLGALGEVPAEGLHVSREAWRITAKTPDKLRPFGVEGEKTDDGFCFRAPAYPAIGPAWRQRSLAARPGGFAYERMPGFLFGYDAQKPYTAEQLFGKLYGDPAPLRWLDAYFPAHGYALGNHPSDLRMDYTREYPDKNTGFARAFFRARDRAQMSFTFRVPQFRRLLAYYDGMPPPSSGRCASRAQAAAARAAIVPRRTRPARASPTPLR